MRFYHTFTRAKLLGILSALLLLLLLVGQFVSAKTERNAATHALRISYIERLGYRVDEQNATCKQVRVPEKFSPVYERYNALQKAAGFDLSDDGGCEVTVYSYPLAENPNRIVNLMVYDGSVIGGDVSDTALGGQMLPLTERKEESRK